MDLKTDRHNGHRDALELTAPRKSRFNFRSLADLALEQVAVEYDVEGVMASGQPLVIVGRSKTMKTTIALDLALCLTTGGSFLGRFPCLQTRRVAMVSGETHLGDVRQVLLRQCAAYGHDPDAVSQLFVDREIPRLDQLHDMHDLANNLADVGAEVFILDPFYLSVSAAGRQGNMFEMGRTLYEAEAVLRARGISLVILHHMRKGGKEKYRQPELDESAWAGIEQFARQWIAVSRRSKFVAPLHKLWLQIGGGSGHAGEYAVDIDEGPTDNRHWVVDVKDAADVQLPRAQANGDSRQSSDSEIIATLKELGGWCSAYKVSAKLKANNSRIKAALERLAKAGKVDHRKMRTDEYAYIPG
jgi:hypothetical protein